jgi:hypothetical protein
MFILRSAPNRKCFSKLFQRIFEIFPKNPWKNVLGKKLKKNGSDPENRKSHFESCGKVGATKAPLLSAAMLLSS